MNPILLCSSLLGVSALDSAPASPLNSIEQILNTVIDQTWANKSPGIQVGLWVPGQGEWTIARGLSDLERNKPMKVGIQQPIGSITKTMTGTLILQLVKEGKLSLDDRLSKWYPYAPEGDQTSIAMLLNVTSGIAAYGQGYFDENITQTLLASPHFVFQHELLGPMVWPCRESHRQTLWKTPEGAPFSTARHEANLPCSTRRIETPLHPPL